MKRANTKSKGSFSVKTKIIAMLLAVITALSALTVSVTSVSAAETPKAASNAIGEIGIDTNELLDGITTSVVEKAIEIATKGNPAEAILGAGVSSVLSTVFGSVIGGSSESVSILNAIGRLSDQIAQNHNEEMDALADIKNLVDQISFKQDMQDFNSDYKNMTALYTTLFEMLSNSGADLTTVDDTGKIDKSTYNIYTYILNKTGFNTSMDIDVMFNKMHGYLSMNKSDIYHYMVNNYKTALENEGSTGTSKFDFDSIGDFQSIKANLEQIEADVVLYYTAYLTLLQINYQWAYYNNSEYDQALMETTKKQIACVADKMSEISEAFTSAYEAVDAMTTAHLTVNGTTKYFTLTPLAWSMAVTAVENGKSAEFYLDKDWVAPSEDVGMALKKECLGFNGFYNYSSGNGGIMIKNMNADFTVNLGSCKIDAKNVSKNLPLFNINIYHGNFKICGDSQEAPYQKPVGIELTDQNDVIFEVTDERSNNEEISFTISNMKISQNNGRKLLHTGRLSSKSKKYSHMKVNIDNVCFLNENKKIIKDCPESVFVNFCDVTLSNVLIKDCEASTVNSTIGLYNHSSLTLKDNVEIFDENNMNNPALYGNIPAVS